MSKINRPPIGLQGLLGSKNFGVNPSDLGQVVQPTLDLLPFLGVYQVNSVRATGTINGRGQVAAINIPDGEIWMPIMIGASHNGATQASIYRYSVRLVDMIGIPTGLPFFLAEHTDSTGAIVGDVSSLSWNPPFPFFLSSDITIQLWFDKNPAAAPETAAMTVMYYRIEI